jgi:hypothetical protein
MADVTPAGQNPSAMSPEMQAQMKRVGEAFKNNSNSDSLLFKFEKPEHK